MISRSSQSLSRFLYQSLRLFFVLFAGWMSHHAVWARRKGEGRQAWRRVTGPSCKLDLRDISGSASVQLHQRLLPRPMLEIWFLSTGRVVRNVSKTLNINDQLSLIHLVFLRNFLRIYEASMRTVLSQQKVLQEERPQHKIWILISSLSGFGQSVLIVTDCINKVMFACVVNVSSQFSDFSNCREALVMHSTQKWVIVLM